jgi:hypothetical protein
MFHKEGAASFRFLSPLQTKGVFVAAEAEPLKVPRGNTGQGPIRLVSVGLLNAQPHALAVMAKGAAETAGRVVSKDLRRMIEEGICGTSEQRILHGKMAGLAEITDPCVGQEDLFDPVPSPILSLVDQPGPLLQGLGVLPLPCNLNLLPDPLPEHLLVAALEALPFLLSFGTKNNKCRNKTCDHEDQEHDARREMCPNICHLTLSL